MTTTYATERSVVGVLFSTWNDCPVLGPNEGVDQLPGRSLPQPNGDRTNPARYLRWDISYQSAELATFSGAGRIDGYVEIEICIERGVGDGKLRALREALRTLFASGDGSGIQFLEPMPDIGISPETEADWYIAPLLVPFVRFTDTTA